MRGVGGIGVVDDRDQPPFVESCAGMREPQSHHGADRDIVGPAAGQTEEGVLIVERGDLGLIEHAGVRACYPLWHR